MKSKQQHQFQTQFQLPMMMIDGPQSVSSEAASSNLQSKQLLLRHYNILRASPYHIPQMYHQDPLQQQHQQQQILFQANHLGVPHRPQLTLQKPQQPSRRGAGKDYSKTALPSPVDPETSASASPADIFFMMGTTSTASPLSPTASQQSPPPSFTSTAPCSPAVSGPTSMDHETALLSLPPRRMSSGRLTIVPGSEPTRSLPEGAFASRAHGVAERTPSDASIQRFRESLGAVIEGSERRRGGRRPLAVGLEHAILEAERVLELECGEKNGAQMQMQLQLQPRAYGEDNEDHALTEDLGVFEPYMFVDDCLDRFVDFSGFSLQDLGYSFDMSAPSTPLESGSRDGAGGMPTPPREKRPEKDATTAMMASISSQQQSLPVPMSTTSLYELGDTDLFGGARAQGSGADAGAFFLM